MARRRSIGQEPNTTTLILPNDGDLPRRLKKLARQTGLSQPDLIQKWILQEESMVSIMSHQKAMAAPKVKADTKAKGKPARKARVKKQPVVALNNEELESEAAEASKKTGYRDWITEKISAFRKKELTYTQIADIFNKNNVTTISGTGKWYTSSVSWLLRISK